MIDCHRLEASPLLPWMGSREEPSESYNAGGIDELLNFGLASAGAEHDGRDGAKRVVIDEIDMAEVERRLDSAIAGFDADEEVRRSSV